MTSAATKRRFLIGSLAVLALAVGSATIGLTATYWGRRYGFPTQRLQWGGDEYAYFSAAWASVLLAEVGGLWLWWRAPRNATGMWLFVAGFALGCWFIGTYWPSAWGMQLHWLTLVSEPALAMAFLGWPTGRPTRSVRRWILSLLAASTVLAISIHLFGRSTDTVTWPHDPLAPFAVNWVGPLFGSISEWLFDVLPAIAFMVLLVRRRRRLPASARRLLTPITVTGVLIAISDLITVLVDTFFADDFTDASRHTTLLGTFDLTQNYGQFAIAAIGLLVAFSARRRAAAAPERHLELDLGLATPLTSSARLQRFLDDPTARVVYPRADGTWVDSEGAPTRADAVGRSMTPVVDDIGRTIAAIEIDLKVGSHPSLIEIGSATVATQINNERAIAIAKARQSELATLQQALLKATDDARLRLERDLHDGAQQQLVGVTLAARLAARQPSNDLATLRAEVRTARIGLLDLVEGAVPVVLAHGLAAALTILAAMTPLDATAGCRGDLDPNDPLSRILWLVANEAVTNAVKHADASTLRIELTVDPSAAVLRITDDGRGGVTALPRTIAARTSDVGATVDMRSPVDAGTELVVAVARKRTVST